MEGAAKLPDVFLNASASVVLQIHDPLELLLGEAFGIMDEAAGVGEGDDLTPELDKLFCAEGGHVAGARHHAGSPFDALPVMAKHVVHHVDHAVARGFRTDPGATKLEGLTGQHAFEAIHQALVLTEHVAHFPGAHADIPRRHVRVRADVARQFGHEGLAEAHDLCVGLTLRVEVRAALTAAHGQTGQAVLEHLLKGEELQDALRHRGVEANAALVGADGVVLLNAEAAIDANVAVVVFPHHPEGDDAVRFGHPLEDHEVFVDLFVGDVGNDVHRHFVHRLVEFRLAGVAAADPLHELF